jgi:hypothetical protein
MAGTLEAKTPAFSGPAFVVYPDSVYNITLPQRWDAYDGDDDDDVGCASSFLFWSSSLSR